VVEVNDRARTALVAISSEHADRHDSVISQRGLRYLQDLPVLIGHHSGQLPVARTSRIWLGRGPDGVATTFAQLRFPPEGQVPASDEAYQAMKVGLADSVSIGFWIDRVSQRQDGLLSIDQAELAEISVVAVPANPQARVLEVNRATHFETRSRPMPQLPARIIHAAPAIVGEASGLADVQFTDFAALALSQVEAVQRDVGPAREWSEELVRQNGGKAPGRGVLMPLGLLFTDAKDIAKRAAVPLATEELMRNLLDYYVAAMRAKAFFGPLGVTMLSPSEMTVRIPSVATPGAASSWIGKDIAATPTAIPTFTDVTATPHTLSTLRLVPRSLLIYSGGVAENVVRDDMAGAHIAKMQSTYIFGDVATDANSPNGLFKAVAASSYPAAAAILGRAELLKFIAPVENTPLIDNAQLRWFMAQPLWRTLQQTTLFPDTTRKSDDTVLAPDSAPDGPNLLGYPYVSSQYLRSNQGAGTPPSDCDLVFGDFSSTYWTSWQSANIMANPYSADPLGFRAGGIELLILSDHDLMIRDPARFVRTLKASQVAAPALAASKSGH
jgi:HK97 family phage prohead protease